MKKITSYIGKHWIAYVFAIVCMIGAIALDMLYPFLIKTIVDDVIKGGQLELLKGLLIGIVIVGVGRCIFGYCKEYIFDRLASKIGSEIRKDLFDHLQTLSIRFFHNTNTGELMARVKDDVDKLWNVLGFVSMLIIEVVIHVSSVLYCMFYLNWRLAFLPLFVMAVCGIIAVVMERKLDAVYEDISEENAVLTSVAEENLAGVRTVKAFAREKHEIMKFLSHNNRYYELNIRQSNVLVKYDPYFSFVGKLLPVLVTILGGIEVLHGRMTLGGLVAFVDYSGNCTWPMEMMGWLSNELGAATASYKKIKKIYDEKPEIANAEVPEMIENVAGEVSFEHVGFGIGETQILRDISFTLGAGKTLGIMGETGSGKSSIIHLLQRFYDVTEGSIRLDNIDIRSLTLKQLRSSIAVVQQDVFLFSDTIEENVKMGQRKTMLLEDVKTAVHHAQAGDFVEKLEEQYETVIGERGVGLSGGQKQRISIARALAKKSPVLVLDDATSALDMETEHEMQKTLNSLKGITKIIVAHRISAVRHADEIIYLQDGQIAERGTHEELLALKGLYYATFKAQYGDYLENNIRKES